MNRMRPLTTLSVALAATLTFAGCTTMNGYTGQTSDPNDPNRTQRGALIGAGIGAVAGLLSGSDATERRQRALIGAGVGALAGGAIGRYQDNQEAALRREMQGTGVEVVRQGDNITLDMPSAITFAFDSSSLNPAFHGTLDRLANTMNEYGQTIIEVAGHKVDNPPIRTDTSQKPPVPTLAIWSRGDGIVAPAAARGKAGERDAELEMDCSHMGFATSGRAYPKIIEAVRGFGS